MDSKLTFLISLTLKEIRLFEDYLQLLFSDDSILNIYNIYRHDGQSLVSFTGQNIIKVYESDKQVILEFSNNNSLTIGLEGSDYNGPEAMELITHQREIIIWN